MVSLGDTAISLTPAPTQVLVGYSRPTQIESPSFQGGGITPDQLKSEVPQSGQVFIFRGGGFIPHQLKSKVLQSGQVFIWGGVLQTTF